MNYIILNYAVSEVLSETYQQAAEHYGYGKAFDSYLVEQLSFDRVYKIFNRCREEKTYYLIGKNCILSMEISSKYTGCFFAKKIRFFQNSSEFAEKLAQTLELPGDWDVMQFKDSFCIDPGSSEDLSWFLEGFKASYQEYYAFEGKWKTWDLYNKKLRELEEQAEMESEREVRSVLLENNVFFITADALSGLYEPQTDLYALFDEKERYSLIGKIETVNRQDGQLTVICEDHELLKNYAEKRIGKLLKIRRIDVGSLTRLRRQEEAMKRLFQNEAANPNIRQILIDGLSFPEKNRQECEKEIERESFVGMFGSNLKQKEAFIGAIDAPDLYLIQGPPGTGKTTIITEIVRHVIQNAGKVLVSSETNIAVDNVLARIQYAHGVVPVRLGRAERMDEACIDFLPEKIAETVLQNVREQNERFEKEAVDAETLLLESRQKWNKKDEKIAKQITKMRAAFQTDTDLVQLLKDITRFEELVSEMNAVHTQLETERKPYTQAKSRQLKLEAEKAALQEQLHIEACGIMNAGIHFDNGTSQEESIRKAKERLLAVSREAKEVQAELCRNRYETLLGAYKRKMRRLERRKQELLQVLGTNGSLLAAAHQAKKRILDIQMLEKQRKALNSVMQAEQDAILSDYKHQKDLWERSREIRADWIKATAYAQTKEEIETIHMQRANAVFATCSGIAALDHGKFAEIEYDYVIIDEAAKCNMMDLLIPLVRGRKIILVGDHKQLYPMLKTEEVKDEISEQQLAQIREHILFKWLYEERVPKEYKIMLNSQYRMEQTISRFISDSFYEGRLVCEKDQPHDGSMVWMDCEDSCEELAGTSYRNLPEAELMMRLVAKLDDEYQSGIQAGIICAYKAQADLVKKLLEQKKPKNIQVECSTVDAFQGKEKHTII